jgi:hypothetical protein
MLDDRSHAVLVVDEFGGTAGPADARGRARGAGGRDRRRVRRSSSRPGPPRSGSGWCPGTMRRDELERLSGLELGGDAETVSGAIVEMLGRLLERGDRVRTDEGGCSRCSRSRDGVRARSRCAHRRSCPGSRDGRQRCPRGRDRGAAAPAGPDEQLQLRMPAVRQRIPRVEVVAAAAAPQPGRRPSASTAAAVGAQAGGVDDALEADRLVLVLLGGVVWTWCWLTGRVLARRSRREGR